MYMSLYTVRLLYGNCYSWSHDSLRLIWAMKDVIQIGRVQKRQYDNLYRRDAVTKKDTHERK
jgi:hypothetical protein